MANSTMFGYTWLMLFRLRNLLRSLHWRIEKSCKVEDDQNWNLGIHFGAAPVQGPVGAPQQG